MGVTAVVAQIAQDETFRPNGMWQPLGDGAFYALLLRQNSDRSKSFGRFLDLAGTLLARNPSENIIVRPDDP